jgi:hypothetical protein
MTRTGTDGNNETPIAATVRSWIDQRPAVRDALRMGIVNLSALARLIMKETGIDREDAVIASCRRYDIEPLGPGYQEDLREILDHAQLEMRSHVAILTLRPSWDVYHRLERAMARFKDEHTPLHVIQGADSLTIVTEERVLDELEGILGKEQVIKKRTRLVELNVRVAPESETVPGIIAFLSSSLSERGINLVESLSVYKDNMFLIDEDDLLEAYNILNRLLRSETPPITKDN